MTQGDYPEDLPGEDWRPLPPPHGDWLISDHGRVWSMRGGRLVLQRLDAHRHKSRARLSFKLPMLDGNGANPGRPGRAYSQTARATAHMVLLTFVGPPPGGTVGPAWVATCIDGDETNVCLSNLEWRPNPGNRQPRKESS